LPARETPRPFWQSWLALGAALFGLNLALSFHNVWSTPWVTTHHEVSVEAAILVLLMALYAQWRQPPAPRLIAWLAVMLAILVLGRYAEVTAPMLYGRPVNLFWDVRHLPQVAAMIAEAAPWWQVTMVLVGAAALLALIILALRWMLLVTTEALAAALPRRAVIGLSSALLAIFSVGHLIPQSHTLHWFSLPVTLTYARQLSFLHRALADDDTSLRIDVPALPASGLERVSEADFMVLFLESYGAVTFDRPEYARALANSRAELTTAVARSGRKMVSAFVRSPTFGGASWLAHSSFLSGIEVADKRLYELLLTRKRETLVQRFAGHGYRTLALMPGIRKAWPEGDFYGFDKIYDATALEYQGPAFGWWRIPDQYALARLDALELTAGERAPVMLFFTTTSSHAPFRPTPPYQPDWQALLGTEPYGPDATAAQLNASPEWFDLGPAYVDSLNYAMTYLGSYLETRASADLVIVVIGDHQPPAGVSGPEAPWDVPVHIIASRPEIIQALRSEGLKPGLAPRRPAIGPMHALSAKLLRAFDGGARPVPDTPTKPVTSGLDVQPRIDVARSGPQR
jgi:hypothetical protein